MRADQAGMPMQTSLCRPVSVSGIGLHTGGQASVTLRPAPPGTGRVFTVGGTLIPATVEHVAGTRRCTSLAAQGAEVHTVEHVLAALHGMGIDNAEIAVEGPEIPVLDGSARPWVLAIDEAGIAEQDVPAETLRLREPVVYHGGGAWLVAAPAEGLTVTCVTTFDHPLLGTQAASFTGDSQAFALQVAPARTFGFSDEIEALLASGLARGASLANALVVYPDRFSDALRLPDECLRHKMLDLYGDLALAGVRLNASVFALMPGHAVNAAFAGLLAERSRQPHSQASAVG